MKNSGSVALQPGVAEAATIGALYWAARTIRLECLVARLGADLFGPAAPLVSAEEDDVEGGRRIVASIVHSEGLNKIADLSVNRATAYLTMLTELGFKKVSGMR